MTKQWVSIVRDDTGETTAVFLTNNETSRPDFLVCYAHVGQHSECSVGWFLEQTGIGADGDPALSAELQLIYDHTLMFTPACHPLEALRRYNPKALAAFQN